MKNLNTIVVIATFALSLFLSSLRIQPLLAEDSSTALREMAQKVKRYTLSNGLRVIMYNRGTAPVFAGVVSVRVGGSDELLGETGISHMLEHMAFKGTHQIGTNNYEAEKPLLYELEKYALAERNGLKLSSEDLIKMEQIYDKLKKLWVLGDLSVQFERRGANGLNATTDKEFTKYFVELPRTAFEFWCWIESERILNPVMRQFYQERDVVMEERRTRFDDDPEGKLYEMLLGVAYLKHPYRNPVIGYEFDLKNLTATMVTDFQKRFYVPGNIVLSLVGDIDPENDIKIVERYFSRLPNAVVPKKTTILESPQEGERRIMLKTKASPQLYIAYKKPNYPHPDDVPISVMAEMLAGSRVSPLHEEMVKIRKIVSSIDSDEVPGSAFPNLLIFYVSPTNPHTNNDALLAFDSILQKSRRKGLTQELLDIAKRSVAMDYLVHIKSSMSLAQDFASSEHLYGNWKASLDWYDEAMKVTLEDIHRVMDKYLKTSNRTIGTIEFDNSSSDVAARAQFQNPKRESRK